MLHRSTIFLAAILTVMLTIILLPASVTLAQGERNLELAKKLTERKVERFFGRIESNKTLDATLKAQIAKLKPGAVLGGEYGAIHQSLLLMNADYKKAGALLMGERYAAASDLFRQVATSDDTYLKAYATFRYGLSEMNREQYETAADAFQTVLNEWGRYVGCDIESAFYIAVCYGQLRDKEKAIISATRFLEDYPDAPERYRRSMDQMKNELVQEWESPLYDLAGKMNHVARRIEKGETASPTQVKQKEIVDILSELIKKAEQKEGSGKDSGGGGGDPRGNRKSSSPASKSKISPGASRVGNLRGKGRKKPGSKWGEMRDKERDEVLQALKEKFPGRYRELQEQYDRAIAEGKRVTESSGDNHEEK